MQTRRQHLATLASLALSASCAPSLLWPFIPEKSYKVVDGSPDLPAVVFNNGAFDSGLLQPYVDYFSDKNHTTVTWEYSPTANLMSEFVEELDTTINYCTKSKPIIFGYSLGGMTALSYGCTHPDKCASIVALASAHRFFKHDSAYIAEVDFFSRLGVILDTFSQPIDISRILAPTLAIHGTYDEVYSRDSFEELETILSGSEGGVRRVEIPGAGHGLPITHVNEVIDTLEENYKFLLAEI